MAGRAERALRPIAVVAECQQRFRVANRGHRELPDHRLQPVGVLREYDATVADSDADQLRGAEPFC